MAVIPYCSTANVSALNQGRSYDATSQPTKAEVSTFITHVSAEMNSRMDAAGITVPIATSPVTNQNTYLRSICAHGAAAMAERAATMQGDRQESDHVSTLEDWYEERMKGIEENKAIPVSGSNVAMNSYQRETPDQQYEQDDEPYQVQEDNW